MTADCGAFQYFYHPTQHFIVFETQIVCKVVEQLDS